MRNITIKHDGELCENAAKNAGLFNSYFASVFSFIENPNIPNFKQYPYQYFPDIIFYPEKVYAQLKSLNNKSSKGPDNIPQDFLINFAFQLAEPLSKIYQVSLDSSDIPNDWRLAHIVPIFKKGSRQEVSNYRGVSLLCTPSKPMEAEIADVIMDYLKMGQKFFSGQHGFLPNKSTTSQLLCCLNSWTAAVDHKEYIDVVYIDISKAFDTVNHLVLVAKLRSLGISESVVSWISNYLSYRTQCVKIGDCFSTPVSIASGVPQGSILGPLLFLCYINDLPEVLINSKAYIFADDAKIYLQFPSSESNQKLVQDIERVFEWAESRYLKISYPKCSIMHIGHGNNSTDMHVGDIVIPNSKLVKDLGVWVSEDLNFSHHIDTICKSANQMVNLLFLSFETRNPKFLLNLFKTYILPKLEYGSEIWSPHMKKDIIKLERVQRRFTKRLLNCLNLSYEDRLQKLDIKSLQERRIKKDLTYIFKMLHGKIDVNFDDFFQFSQNSATRGHSYKLFKQPFRLDCRKYFFSNRSITLWNSLPEYVVNCYNLSNFNSALQKIDFSDYLGWS